MAVSTIAATKTLNLRILGWEEDAADTFALITGLKLAEGFEGFEEKTLALMTVTNDFKDPLYKKYRHEISATTIRDHLRKSEEIPSYLIRSELSKFLSYIRLPDCE